MALAKLTAVIEAEDRATAVIAKVGKSAEGLQKSVGNLQPVFKSMAIVGGVAFGAITLAIKSTVDGAMKAESAQNRLAQILKTSTSASDAQIESLSKQAEALERVGVVSADAIRVGQGQLASFDLQSQSIEKLIPSILNYAVAEKGLNMTSEELKAVTNGLAQAMQGNFTSLTKTGFVLDETTEKMISEGTETERVSALTKVLDSTYKGLNESMRKTSEGGIVGLQFAMDRLKDSIGSAMIPTITKLVKAIAPIIEKITEWIEKHPKLASSLLIAGVAVSGLTMVIGLLGLAIPPIIKGIGFLQIAMDSLIGRMLIAVAPIAAIATALGVLAYVVFKDLNYQTEQATAENDRFAKVANSTADRLQQLKEPLKQNADAMKALAEKSKVASEELEKVQKQITKTVEAHNNSVKEGERSVADAFLDQEKKIADIEKDIIEKKTDLKKLKRDEDSSDRRQKIQEEISELQINLEQERNALQAHQGQKEGLEAQFIEAKRFRDLTEFEQKLERLAQEKAEEAKAFAETMSTLNKEKVAKFAVLEEIRVGEKKLTDDLVAEQKRQTIEKVQLLKTYEMDYAQHLQNLKDIEANSSPLKQAVKGIGNFLIDKVGGGINKVLGINDGIVQNGQVITTHPDDYIIATKTPGTLGGGGKNITININGAVLTKEVASTVGDMIINELRTQMRF